MNIETKFSLEQIVKLPLLHKNLEGIVVGIWITIKGIKYEVRYFWECKPQEVYFYEWELEPIDN